MTIGVDAPRVANGEEANLLLVHHLRLAAMYFEASTEDLIAVLPSDDFSLPAMQVWVGAMEALYPGD